MIYACSGCADLGEIADKTARYLAKNGYAKMTCLSSLGAHLPGFIKSAKSAAENAAIDGCGIACGKKVLEGAGVSAKSIILTDMGYKKNETPVTKEIVEEIGNKLIEKFPEIFAKNHSDSSVDCGCSCSGECT